MEMTEFDHLYCEGCGTNPTYALRDGEGVLVCHCTGDYDPRCIDPVAVHGLDDLPEQWSFEEADGLEPDRSLDDYDRLEDEVGEWADENFGTDQPDFYALIGAAEEIGEIAGEYQITKEGRMSMLLQLLEDVGNLCHAILKDAQGIREDDRWVGDRAEKRAISQIHSDLAWVEDMESVGSAELRESAYEDVADGVGDVHVYLADYGHRNPVPLSLAECVDYAWYGEVVDRDWDADVEVEDA